jgi:hypothetical protein
LRIVNGEGDKSDFKSMQEAEQAKWKAEEAEQAVGRANVCPKLLPTLALLPHS